jgi:hypothetical protein
MTTKTQLFNLVLMISMSNILLAQNTLPTSGNVGIGTTSPTSEFEVMGTSTLGKISATDTAYFDKPVIIKDTLNVKGKMIVDNDVKIKGEAVFVENAKAKADFKILGTTKMKGDGFVEGNFFFKSLKDTSSTDDKFIMINANGKVKSITGIDLQDIVYADAAFATCLALPNGNTPAPVWSNIQGTTTTPGTLYTGTNCPAKVGIGISNPQFTLDVAGTAHISGALKVANNSIYIASTNQSTGTNNNIYATGDLLIQSDAANPFNTIINANNTGFVGIGLTNPGHQLEVAGTVRACKFIAEANTWSDYVFEEDYQLMTLEELENYITTHKHLPDVPSTEEVMGAEIDIVEMETILLKKIEELTLYVLQQQKEIEMLKNAK